MHTHMFLILVFFRGSGLCEGVLSLWPIPVLSKWSKHPLFSIIIKTVDLAWYFQGDRWIDRHGSGCSSVFLIHKDTQNNPTNI